MFIRINRFVSAGLIVALVALAGAADFQSRTTETKIDSLHNRINVEQMEKRKIEQKRKAIEEQKFLLDKSHQELDQTKQRLEQENQQKQQEIDNLNQQLQAKREAKSRTIAAQVQRYVAPKAYAAPVYAVSTNAAKAFIYSHESGNNPGAINKESGACGIGQRLPCSILLAECTLQDYACQDAHFTRYMQGRYGTWENAHAFWVKNRWW